MADLEEKLKALPAQIRKLPETTNARTIIADYVLPMLRQAYTELDERVLSIEDDLGKKDAPEDIFDYLTSALTLVGKMRIMISAIMQEAGYLDKETGQPTETAPPEIVGALNELIPQIAHFEAQTADVTTWFEDDGDDDDDDGDGDAD